MRQPLRKTFAFMLGGFLLISGGALPAPGIDDLFGTNPAAADDDDDDDGDDGGSRAGDSDRGGGEPAPRTGSGGGLLDRLFGREPERPAARAAAPRPVAANGEVVVVGLGQSDLDRLAGEGFELLADLTTRDGERIVRLRLPRGTGPEEAIRRIGELAPDASADRNHFYRPEADEGACDAEVCRSWSQIGWQAAAARSCAAGLTIGVVDTGVNPDHEAFDGRRLEVVTLWEERDPPSERKHGTAVVALLIGAPGSRVPGLLPEARVVAADPFTRAGGDERTDAFALVAALEAIAAEGADIASLSLSGPDNRVLALRIASLVTAGIPVVAAVGNGGPNAKPLYPAAYPGVIGVTAVDGKNRAYRRALRGDQVDFAAPGVAIPTAASIRGLRPQTGTSFAVPFVTAAAALVIAGRPDIAPVDVERALSAGALDLGAPGRDPTFGHGLLQAAGTCPPEPVATSEDALAP